VRTYYQLLGVADSVAAEEIKRAFRREIARYHPDKVQHLGIEFQDIAAVRASELTEAYRILMDQKSRGAYDQSLKAEGAATHPLPPPAPPAPAGPVGVSPEEPTPRPTEPPLPFVPPSDRRFQKERATTSHFIRRATLSRVREAVAAVAASAVPAAGCEFDVAFDMGAKGGLFRKTDPPLRLLAEFVRVVDAAAIQTHWPPALEASKGMDLVCLLLLGAAGMAPARELSLAVADQRRRTRTAGPILVPVDVRDWDALFPPDTPASVRAIVQWLKQKV
jgi:hypothetical protein